MPIIQTLSETARFVNTLLGVWVGRGHKLHGVRDHRFQPARNPKALFFWCGPTAALHAITRAIPGCVEEKGERLCNSGQP